ncbi:MAG: cation diffusion facilitator family transporter [Pseudomonadales bacterium]
MQDLEGTKITTEEGKKKTHSLLILSSVVDLLLGLVKVTVGWFANSHALIADGFHSFSDLATDLMVWFINRVGAEEPDENHPYGHAKFETFGALLLGAILILVAGILVYDSVLRLINIEVTEVPSWPALLAAMISIATKEWLYRITRKLGDSVKSNLLLANAWHHRSDAFSSVIVLIGVGGAILGVSWLEMIAAIGVAFMIAAVGWRLIKDSVEELVDTALSESYVEDIQKTIEDADGVRGVHSLRTRRMGATVILDIHLQVDPTISVSEGHYVGDWVCRQLQHKFHEIGDITVHIDAEDDTDAKSDDTSMDLLPLRNDVRSALSISWSGLLEEKEIENMTLHYLNRVINVELFLTSTPIIELNASDNEKLKEELRGELTKKLKEATSHLRWLGDISLWSKLQ